MAEELQNNVGIETAVAMPMGYGTGPLSLVRRLLGRRTEPVFTSGELKKLVAYKGAVESHVVHPELDIPDERLLFLEYLRNEKKINEGIEGGGE